MLDAIAEPQPAAASASHAEIYTILPGSFDTGLVVLCDHAGNAFPPEYGSLGLAPADLERHIAYDIGARPLTERLSAALGAPAILSRYSRLLIDLNRGEDDPTLIMRLADGVVVQGNRAIDAAERAKRIGLYHRPYHRAVDELIDRSLAAGVTPALLSIHTFTERWKGAPRPWHAAVLWDRDPRLALPLLEALREEQGLLIGENEPYSGRLEGDSMWQHGTSRGLPHALIEVRQDLVRSERGQAEWGDRLARIMRKLLGRAELRAELRRLEHCPASADLPLQQPAQARI